MRLSDDDLKQLHRLAAEAAPDRRECPDPAMLARAASQELTARERAQLADHLGACRMCADEYRLLTPLETWADDATRSLGGTPSRQARAAWPGSFALPHTLAASFLVACLGLTAWNLGLRGEAEQHARQLAARQVELERARVEVGELRRQVEALAEPQLNVPIIDLESDGARGAEPAAARVDLAQDAAALTAILHGSSNRKFPAYSVALLDADGRVLWQGTGLRRSADGTFTLVLPARLLPSGGYRLRLLGGDTSGPLLDEYPLAIRR